MMKPALEPVVDSDSGRTPSDEEKRVALDPLATAKYRHGDLPDDPDPGASEEERARIVSFQYLGRREANGCGYGSLMLWTGSQAFVAS